MSEEHIKPEYDEQSYSDEIRFWRERVLQESNSIDKSITTLSSGGIAFTVVIIKDYFKSTELPIFPSLFLWSAWVAFAFALGATLNSYWKRKQTIHFMIKYLKDSHDGYDATLSESKYQQKENIANMWQKFASFSFIAGLVCTILFVFFGKWFS